MSPECRKHTPWISTFFGHPKVGERPLHEFIPNVQSLCDFILHSIRNHFKNTGACDFYILLRNTTHMWTKPTARPKRRNEWMNEWKCNITKKSNITQYWWDSYNVLKRTTSIKIMQFHLGKHVAEDHHGVRLSAQSSPTLLSNWLIKDAYVTQFWFEISPVFVWSMVGKEEGGGNRSVDGSGDRTNLKPKNCNTDDSSQNCSLQRPIFVSDFMEKPAQDHCF